MEVKDISEIREEIRRELEAEQRYEAEQRKLNRNAFKKVMNDFEDCLNEFNWEQQFICRREWNETSYMVTEKRYDADKVKRAISTLACVAFRAKTTGSIPRNKEEDLRNMTQKLLDVVFSYREPNKN